MTTPVFPEIPVGVANGMNAIFVAAKPVADELLFVDRVVQIPGLDYTAAGATILAGAIPPMAAKLALYNGLVFQHPAEIPIGVVNGVNPLFQMNSSVVLQQMVFVDRVLQIFGTDYTIVVGGVGNPPHVLQFVAGAIPQIGSDIHVWSNSGAHPTTFDVFDETPGGAVDGVNDSFTTAFPAIGEWLFVDRVLQVRGVDYVVGAGGVVFLPGAIPQVGSFVRISYDKAGTQVAYPINWRTVRFVLAQPPDNAVSRCAPGDALNPASWAISRVDTGQVYTPIVVAQVDVKTFDVTVREQLPSHLIAVLGDSSGVVTGGGAGPGLVGLQGMTWKEVFTPEAATARKRKVGTDLANPPTFKPGTSDLAGTLVLRGGDYTTVSGVDLVRKLIFRRLMTSLGSIFHLPKYGLGVLAVKDLFLPTDLPALKAEIERQCKLEPEVRSVKAGVTIDGNGILYISVDATVAPTGEKINVSMDSTFARAA